MLLSRAISPCHSILRNSSTSKERQVQPSAKINSNLFHETELNLYGGKIVIHPPGSNRAKSSMRSNNRSPFRNIGTHSPNFGSILQFSEASGNNFSPKIVKNQREFLTNVRTKGISILQKQKLSSEVGKSFAGEGCRRNTKKSSKKFVAKKYNKSLCRYFADEIEKIIQMKN